jgi:PBP1b-binding outer membrane lipoprotein LpoB
MKSLRIPLLALSVLLFLPSCSDPKADYDTVQKIQEASELTIARTSDFDVKIKACDDAINALQTFVAKHQEGEWTNTAKTALDSWQSKKSSLQQEVTSLSEELYRLMNDRATELASSHHPVSKIEKIQLADRQTKKEADQIVVSDSYTVKMRGAILGKEVFNFSVKVLGHISTNSKSVAIDNAVIDE